MQAVGVVRRVAVVAVALVLIAGEARAQSGEGTVELPAGGLLFVPTNAIVKQLEEIAISRERVQLSYELVNKSLDPVINWVSFALPDLDMATIGDQEVLLPRPDPKNFVEFETLVDGTAVTGESDQRAYTINRDVSALLGAHNIPVFPFIDGLVGQLGDLPGNVRRDLTERGVLRNDAGRPDPGWLVKTVFAWRQSYEPEKVVRIRHSYRPIVGTHIASPQTLASLKRTFCMDDALIKSIESRTRARANAVDLTSVTYLVAASASWWTPIREYRLSIARRDTETIVATCVQGLRAAGPTLLELRATNFTPEDDIHVLFIR